MADERHIRFNERTVGKVTTRNGTRVFIWYQNLLRFYGESGGFSMSESLLQKIPTSIRTFIVVTKDDDEFLLKREQFETGEKIPIYDSRFKYAPDEPQYAVPKEEAQKLT